MVGMQQANIRRALADRQATHAANLDAATTAEQLRAERVLAVSLLRNVSSPGWWEIAGSDDVARALAVAETWEGQPFADSGRARLLEGIEQRPQVKASILEQHPQLRPLLGDLPVPAKPVGATEAAGVALAVVAEMPDVPGPKGAQNPQSAGVGSGVAVGCSAEAARVADLTALDFPGGRSSPLARSVRAAAGPNWSVHPPGLWIPQRIGAERVAETVDS